MKNWVETETAVNLPPLSISIGKNLAENRIEKVVVIGIFLAALLI